MLEISKYDFDDEFMNIQASFRSAKFFAVDNEFSGLVPREKLSQFDSMDERYLHLLRNIKDYVSLQIGITAFQFSEDTNVYTPTTYCFFLFPQSFGSVDTEFICKTSSLEFLRQHDFDFNKLIYHGIPYLSHHKEKELRKAFNTGEFKRKINEFLSFEERKELQNICLEVPEKIAMMKSLNIKEKPVSADQPSEKTIEDGLDFKIEVSPLLAFAVSHEIHQRFPEIIIHPESYGMRLMFQSTPEKPPSNFSEVEKAFVEKIISSLQGFTRIFDLLIDLKKPIVGHNMFSDLLMMYKQFHGPLPSSLQEFKKEVHSMFPTVYDTKFFCNELKRCHRAHFKKEKEWETSSLEGLYNYFQDGFKGTKYKIPHPSILKSIGSPVEGNFHNAAWDAYCTGYIFVQMLHLLAVLSNDMVYKKDIPTTEEYLFFSKQYSNRVNIIMGNVLYIVLDGEDPLSHRPNLLYVRSRNNAKLNIIEVAKLCSSYGTTDIKKIDKFSALIQIGSKPGYRSILRNLKGHPNFKIERFSAVRHNPTVRFTLWTAFVLVSGAAVFLTIKLVSQIRN